MKISSPFTNTRYKFYKLFDKIGLLKHVNVVSKIYLNNKQIKLPVNNGYGYQNLIIGENWAMKIYAKLLSVIQGAFIDVGVNNGQTLIKIMSLDITRPYLGFEPNPVCYNYSRNLIRENNFQNCKLFPVGLSNENTVLPLYHDTEFASGGSVVPDFRENIQRYKNFQQVALMIGDDIVLKQNLDAVAIIKADVEGAEYEVIDGLKNTIEKYQPVLFLEFLPVYTTDKPNGQLRYQRQEKLLKLLQSLDYKMHRIDETELSLIALSSIEIHGDMNKTNYLFTPAAKSIMIEDLF